MCGKRVASKEFKKGSVWKEGSEEFQEMKFRDVTVTV